MSHHHGMTVRIDGKLERLSQNTHSGRHGWITVFVMGACLNGEIRPVRAIDLPEWFYYRGGTIRTSGHRIELKRNGGLY